MNKLTVGTVEVDLDKLSRNFLEQPWKRKEQPVYQDFYYLYIECNLAKEEMVKILGLSTSQITVHLRHLGIKKSKELKQTVKERQSMLKYGVKHPIAMKETREKIKKSNLEKYGTECVLTLKETHEKARATMKERYGAEHALQVEQFREKMRDTNKEHWGVEYTTQSKDVQEKMKASVREKYGVDNVFELQEFQDLARERMKEKYGKEHAMEVSVFAEKQRNTLEDKYGVRHPLQNDEIKEKMFQKNYEKYGAKVYAASSEGIKRRFQTLEDKYGTKGTLSLKIAHRENLNKEYWEENFVEDGYFLSEKCAEYHNIARSTVNSYFRQFKMNVPRKYDSHAEVELRNFLINECGVECSTRVKTILDNQKELDFYIPAYNIAIEYDGLLFHSRGAGMVIENCDKEPLYHYRKTAECLSKNIQLFHIFENEWLSPRTREIWKSTIKNKLGKSTRVYARKTQVVEITSSMAYEFCEENHLQGGCSALYNYGLMYNGDLIAVMVFNKSRFNKNVDWELVRLCSKKGYTVVGGASKLLSYFRKQHSGSIISYANLRWSKGGLYEKLGFKFSHRTQPNYFYFRMYDSWHANLNLQSRQSFQKHKLKDKLEHFDPELTEVQNMFNNGYRQIFDCGNLVYIMES